MNFLKWFLRTLCKKLYRVELIGLENFEKAGNRVLIVSNHTSFLDAILLSVFLPGTITFAIDRVISQNPLLKPLLSLAKLFPMDPTNPLSIKSLIRYLQKDNIAVIFPEGRITVTGSLMKIYDGTGLVAIKSKATVVPIRVDGAQYTPFSRLRGRVNIRWFPKITITILEPRVISPPESAQGRDVRKWAGSELSKIMTDLVFKSSGFDSTLFNCLLDARKIHGGKHVISEDIQRKLISYDRFVMGSIILGHQLIQNHQQGDLIGVLLPNSNSTSMTFMGMQAYGIIPAMLNYSMGGHGMILACQTAKVKQVITSRLFIKKAKLDEDVKQLAEQVELIYLEDIGKAITLTHKIQGWFLSKLASLFFCCYLQKISPDDAAVVLFTSGSEGVPKGVVLSHRNLLANRAQLASRIDFSAQDIILNALPMFHSFGLTAGTLLPLLSGVKTFLYPSPMHYRIIPEVAYEINATILFGTNTFLNGYAKYAHPYDFYSIRYVFAGAEKLQNDTRQTWAEKFGIRIFEGYGATETSPVLSSNTPMEHQSGSVGLFLPGIEYRLINVPGIEQGGQLHVKGPNIMKGYFLNKEPGVLVPPHSEAGQGWYDTGDIVDIDEEGYIRILGRVKRFAKIAGEMVSLTSIEEMVSHVWPDYCHAVTAIPDEQKGEQIILMTEKENANRKELIAYVKEKNMSELMIPRQIDEVSAIPILGSGKIDYVKVNKLVNN